MIDGYLYRIRYSSPFVTVMIVRKMRAPSTIGKTER